MTMVRNMKGKNKSVQVRLLQVNTTAFLVLCDTHTFNLAVADGAKSLWLLWVFHKVIQALFSLHPEMGYPPATYQDESEIMGRHQMGKVRETTADPVVRVEAQSLAEEIESYRFYICTAVWYEVLSKIQHMSKLMHSPSMQLDVAFDLRKKARDALISYRNTSFSDALTTANTLCNEYRG